MPDQHFIMVPKSLRLWAATVPSASTGLGRDNAPEKSKTRERFVDHLLR
jgi:hypothetical protein